jgi:SAM-dependent methyltransferase
MRCGEDQGGQFLSEAFQETQPCKTGRFTVFNVERDARSQTSFRSMAREVKAIMNLAALTKRLKKHIRNIPILGYQIQRIVSRVKAPFRATVPSSQEVKPDLSFDGKSKDELIQYAMGFFTEKDENFERKKTYLTKHIKRYIATLNILGKGDHQMKLLDIGISEMFMILLHKFTHYRLYGGHYGEYRSNNTVRLRNNEYGDIVEYETIGFNAEKDKFPFEDACFDIVLFCEVLEHLTRDPMFAISEINRILKHGGRVIITTPNIIRLEALYKVLMGYSPYFYATYPKNGCTDRHNREYAPNEVALLLEKGGFELQMLQTRFVWGEINDDMYHLLEKLGMPTSLRGDNIYAVGTKKSAIFDRYPGELYD